jgi:N-acyl-L-homoserine lactone synthetase
MSVDTWMHFDAQGDLLESARECEAEVFLRWFGNTRQQLDEEYGPYEDSSVFLVLADEGGEVLGAVRLLVPGGRAGLKTLVDVGQDPWGVDGARASAAVGIDLGSTWEIATLGVRRGSAASGLRLSLALYHGLITVARANRMTSFVAILDERVRRLLGSVGILTRPLPGTAAAPYLGSASSTPIYAHCTPLLENQRRQFPDSYRLVTLGIGLDGVAVPSLDAFRLRSAAPQLSTARSALVGLR